MKCYGSIVPADDLEIGLGATLLRTFWDPSLRSGFRLLAVGREYNTKLFACQFLPAG